MISMKEIAQSCGVSVATVSKALNGKEDISKATRDRILRKAEEMGYMLNASARALKTNRTYSIGVLFIDSTSAGLAHEYFSEILESFKNTAEESGYDITFISRTISGRPSTFLKHCEYRNFDGVAVISADFADPQIQELITSDLPVVTIDYISGCCPAVVSDNARGLQELVHYAYNKGHRRIAFMHGELTDVTKERMMGFYRACRELGIEPDPAWVTESLYHDMELCAERTAELIALDNRPTCIIFPDDYSYLGSMKVLQDAGLRVPEDISAMGYDGIRLARVIGLTTYRQDTETLGRAACRRLIEKIENPEAMTEQTVVMGRLIEGNTVGTIKVVTGE